MNYFDRFYNTTATIAELGDYDDYEGTYTVNEIGTLKGDLQAYSGGLAETEYGLKIECQCRFYCNANDEIKEGRYLKADDVYYKIMYINSSDFGYEILLKKEDLKSG